MSSRSSASSGRTSVLNASMRMPFASSTSPSICALVSAERSTNKRLRRRLLHVHHRTNLGGNLRLEVVALVEHERHARTGAVRSHGDDLIHDPKQLVGISGADDQVVVGVEAAVEVESTQIASRARRFATMNSMLVPGAWWPVSTRTWARSPKARQCSSDVPQSGTSMV